VTIHPTAIVDPAATLGTGVRIGPYAVVEGPVTLGDGVELMGEGPPRIRDAPCGVPGRKLREGARGATWCRAIAPILATFGLLAPGGAAPGEPARVEALRARLAEAREAGATPAERAALLHDLGGVLAGEERYDEAARAWTHAAQLGERPAASTYNAACALAKADRPGPALDALERAIGLGYDDSSKIERDDDLVVVG